jgi:hypothetical protein
MRLLLLVAAAANRAAAASSIGRDTPIVVSAADLADSRIALALADLRRDFYSVFGSPPVVLDHVPHAVATPEAPAIVLGSAGRALLPAGDRCASAAEAHCVVLRGPTLIATGDAASLGAVYGLYALSEHLLGVVPLHAFADLAPARRRALELPAALALRFEPRGWETRAVFVNDEDLTAGFGADPLGDGIGAETYNRLYEALLRLKANGVISGTANFPDQRGGTTLAAKRGLRLLQHHVTPVGLNTMRWPNAPVADGGALGFSRGGAPFSFLNSPAVLEHAWGASIDGLVGALPAGSNATEDVLWTIGLRGMNDYAWWVDSRGDERALNITLRGEVIGAAMTAQLVLLRGRLSSGVESVAYMWSEMLELWQAGSLRVPEGVTVVFADGGGGKIQGLQAVRPGDGLYYHVADRGNQLSEWVAVSTVLAQLSAFFTRARRADGRASVFILNASDLKPYLLSLAAAMAFAFDPTSAGTDPSAFVRRWAAQHYGAASAGAVAAVHEEYAALSAKAKAVSDYGLVIALQNLADEVLARAVHGDFNFSSLHAGAAAVQESSAATAARWQALSQRSEAVLPTLAERAQRMFASHCLAQQYLLGNGSRALERLAAAVLTPSADGSLAAAGEAAAAMEGACAALRLAGGAGRWAGYFAHDRLVDIEHSRRLLSSVVAALNRSALLPARPICSCTGGIHNCSGSVPYAECPDMFANQLPPAYAGAAYPLLYRSPLPAANFDGVVRGGCSGSCDTTPSGGLVHGAATAWLALPAGGPGVVRFTLDGSLPTATSPRYSSPISLHLNTTVTARAVGVAAGVATPSSVFKYFAVGREV